MVFRLIVVIAFAGGIGGCSSEQPSVPHATPAAFNIAGAPTVEFSVPDMMCPEGCGVKTKQILAEQSGVKDVIVDFESKTATVAIEEGKFDGADAIAALVDHGFDHSTLKSDAAATEVADAVAKPQAAEEPAVQ
jgi:copper chaperone CopZ